VDRKSYQGNFLAKIDGYDADMRRQNPAYRPACFFIFLRRSRDERSLLRRAAHLFIVPNNGGFE
jgi:hypothetical protein